MQHASVKFLGCAKIGRPDIATALLTLPGHNKPIALNPGEYEF